MSKYVNKEVENTAIFADSNYVPYGSQKEPHPEMEKHIRAMSPGVTNFRNNGFSFAKKHRRVGKLTMPAFASTGKQKRDAAQTIFKKGVVDKLIGLAKIIAKDEGAHDVNERAAAIVAKLLKRKNLIGATLVKTKKNAKGKLVAEKSFTLTAKHFKTVKQRFV